MATGYKNSSGIDLEDLFVSKEAAGTGSGPVPVGAYICFAGKTVPTGYLLCNGAAVSRTTYSALFAVIGTTYGSGDGSTTFNLPNANGRVLQGTSTTSDVGTMLESGLPNITGSFDAVVGGRFNSNTYGAFVNGSQYDWQIDYGASDGFGGRPITFNASRSSAIYGKSSTVQSPAIYSLVAIKY